MPGSFATTSGWRDSQYAWNASTDMPDLRLKNETALTMALPSAKGVDQLLERDHLTATRGRRHHDERRDAGRTPRLDPVEHLRRAAEERDVPEPAIRHQIGDPCIVAMRDRLPDSS